MLRAWPGFGGGATSKVPDATKASPLVLTIRYGVRPVRPVATASCRCTARGTTPAPAAGGEGIWEPESSATRESCDVVAAKTLTPAGAVPLAAARSWASVSPSTAVPTSSACATPAYSVIHTTEVPVLVGACRKGSLSRLSVPARTVERARVAVRAEAAAGTSEEPRARADVAAPAATTARRDQPESEAMGSGVADTEGFSCEWGVGRQDKVTDAPRTLERAVVPWLGPRTQTRGHSLGHASDVSRDVTARSPPGGVP